MRGFVGILFLSTLLWSCGADEAISVVTPQEYFPAYPGSYWYYSNGELSSVYNEYVAHSYRESITSTGYTDIKMVPFIDQKYLYEYKITQNSTEYPLKQFFSTTVASSWVVNWVNGEAIMRETVEKLDSLYIEINNGQTIWDTTFRSVYAVVEYSETLGKTRWYLKEYYALNVGLVQVEVNNPYDTLQPIIQKQLYKYYINE